MNYQTHKSRAEAFAEAVKDASPALRAAVEAEAGSWIAASHYARPGPCRVSYGWCFTHMCRDSGPIIARSLGPYDVVAPGDGPV